jgi:SulP family sulfate permease
MRGRDRLKMDGQGTNSNEGPLERLLPIAGWLPGYPKGLLRFDVVAGVTTAAVAIPKGMAYASIAGLPLQVGLYTALIPMAVYAVLGTSRALSVSTTTTIAILTAEELARIAPGADTARLITVAATLAFLVGAFLVLAWILRLGFLANFISESVLTGFKAGIGLVIIVDQLPKMLGFHIEKSGFFREIGSITAHLGRASVPTLALAAATLVLILLLERYAPRSPAAGLAVGAGIALAAFAGLQDMGIALVGGVPSGFPSFELPDFSLLRQLWPSALGIGLMSFVETVAAGRAFMRQGEPRPASNQELLALGLANLAGSGFQIMPAGGGTSQTAVNRGAGARTQMAELVTVAIVAAALLFLMPVVRLIPQATLAAVIVATTAGLISPAEFRAMRVIRAREFGWAIAATAGVVLLGTLNGILVAVALSLLVMFYEANHPPVYVLARKPGTDVFRPLSPDHPGDETFPGLLILRTLGRVHFANAEFIGDRIWRLIHQMRPKVLLLDCSAVPDFEYTALKAMSTFEQKLKDERVTLWLADLNPEPLDEIERSPLGKTLGHERMFFNLPTAVEKYQEKYNQPPAHAESSRPG